MAKFNKQDREKAAVQAAKSRELRQDARALVDSFGLALSARQREKVVAKVGSIPPNYRRDYLKGLRGNLPAAARSQCRDCVGYVREDVTRCTALDCPLYTVRPYQAGTDDTEPDSTVTSPSPGTDPATTT